MRTRSTILTLTAAAVLTLSGCGEGPSTPSTAATATPGGAAPAVAAGAGSLAVTPAGALAPGQPVTLTLVLKDAAGTPLGPDAIAVSHTEKVHVMIVDAGLEDYTHAHATPATEPGTWSVTFTPRFARAYTVHAEYLPAGAARPADEHGHRHGHGQGHGHDHGASHGHGDGHSQDQGAGHDHGGGPVVVSAPLAVGGEPAPPVGAGQSLTATAGGLAFAVSLGGAATAGAHVPVTIAVTDAGTGQPFAGLEPIMGAYAHLVGFPAGSAGMLHAHPEGAEPASETARGGPVLAFELHPEAAGPTRLFLQVRKGGQTITVPFTLVVAD